MHPRRLYTGTVIARYGDHGEIRSDGGLLSQFNWHSAAPPPTVGQRVTYRAEQPNGIAYDIQVEETHDMAAHGRQ